MYIQFCILGLLLGIDADFVQYIWSYDCLFVANCLNQIVYCLQHLEQRAALIPYLHQKGSTEMTLCFLYTLEENSTKP